MLTIARILAESLGWAMAITMGGWFLSGCLTQGLSRLLAYWGYDLVIVMGRYAFYCRRHKNGTVPTRFVTDKDLFYWDHVYDRFYRKTNEKEADGLVEEKG